MRITEILRVCLAVSVRVMLLSHGIAITREEHGVTRTGPKRHSDVTHELRDTSYRAEALAARLQLSGILAKLF